jgi:hypothetical protein
MKVYIEDSLIFVVNMVFDVITCLTVVGLCLSFGHYFDNDHNPVDKSMKTIINQAKIFDIKAFCQTFIKSFDYIYINNFKHSIISHYFFIWIFICWGISLLLIGFERLSNENMGIQGILLLSAFFGTIFSAVAFLTVNEFEERIPRYNYLFDQLVLSLKNERKIMEGSYGENPVSRVPIINSAYNLLLLLKHVKLIMNGSYGKSKIGQSSLLKCFFISIYIAVLSAIGMMTIVIIDVIGIKAHFPRTGFPDIPFFHMGMLDYFIVCIFLGLVVFIMTFIPSAYAYFFLSTMERYKPFFEISPFILVLSSLFAIILFSSYKLDLISSFIIDHQQFFNYFVPFVFLNILADSFSIVETRYMLSKAVSGSQKRLVFFLFLDFLVSSLIYLIIPILSGNLNLYVEAIFFNGKMPWVGIFYWSSLFTSLFLYLYILSFFVLNIFYKFSNFEYLAERPSHSLGGILSIVVIGFYLLSIWWGIIISNIILIVMLMFLVFFVINIFKKVRTQ